MNAATSWLNEITMADLQQRPEEVYEQLRREAPLAFLPVLGVYVATTAQLCSMITTSPDFEGVLNPAGIRTFGRPCVIDENGPAHDELRAMIDPALHAAAVNRIIETLARPVAREYIAQIENDGSADLMAQYFEPVSVRSLGNLLGLTEISSATLRDWFHRLSASLANVGMNPDGSFADPAGFADGDAAKAEIRAVVDPLIDHWIDHPGDGAISHWLHDGMPSGQTRDREAVYPTLFVFLLGAMQEPGHAMGSTLAGLFTRPAQLEEVIDDPALIPRAVGEGMRWVAPIWSAAARITVRETIVAGVELPAGTVAMVSFGSANRDGDRYAAPTEYDLHRAPLPHLAFGAGAHACAGMHFANQVCRIGLEELFDAIPNIRAADEGVTFWGWSFRGPTALPARWEV
jgi:aromatic O-demethylase, cytochrome P450 subunit